MKNSSTKIYGFAFLIALLFMGNRNVNAQSWNTTGNAATTPGTNFIGTTDAKDFVFKTNNTEKGRVKSNGLWQFGASGNLAKFDSAGNLTFAGNAAYKVAGNKYAFQFAGNPNFGLFFNSNSTQYEFRNGSATSVFSINANNGNSICNGILKVGAYTLPATDGTNGQVLKTNGTGTISWSADNTGTGTSQWITNGSNIYYAIGRVGVGITTPGAQLHVASSVANTMIIDGPAGMYVSLNEGGVYKGYFGSYSGAANDIDFGTGAGNTTGKLNLTIQGTPKMTIDATGKVGIGTTTPNGKLTVSSTSGESVHVESNDSLGAYFSNSYPGGYPGFISEPTATALQGNYTGGTNNAGAGVYGTAFNSNYGVGGIFKGGLIGVLGRGNIIGSSYAGVQGDCLNSSGFGVVCNGDFGGIGDNLYSSDKKLKKNIAPIENSLNKIMHLKPSTYQFRTGEFGSMNLPSGNHYGVIAQDLQQVFPELVHEKKFYNDDFSSFDYLAVNYQELIPVLVSGMQEQQFEILAKDSAIGILQNENSELKSRLDKIENQMQQFDQSLSQCCTNHQSGVSSPPLGESRDGLPKLEQNIPNPFSQNTTIKYYLPQTAKSGVLKIYSLEGVELKSYSISQTGFGQLTVTGNSLPSGVYVYTLIIDGKAIDTKQMILTKN